MSKLTPRQGQPRWYFDERELAALAESIKAEGANWYGVRQVVKRRADHGVPTLDGRPPFDPADETDEKPPG